MNRTRTLLLLGCAAALLPACQSPPAYEAYGALGTTSEGAEPLYYEESYVPYPVYAYPAYTSFWSFGFYRPCSSCGRRFCREHRHDHHHHRNSHHSPHHAGPPPDRPGSGRPPRKASRPGQQDSGWAAERRGGELGSPSPETNPAARTSPGTGSPSATARSRSAEPAGRGSRPSISPSEGPARTSGPDPLAAAPRGSWSDSPGERGGDGEGRRRSR